MESKCFSCKNKNVKTSYGYTTCNYSGSECRNFELYDPVKKTNADRIRAMTDEEMAQVLRNPCDIADHVPTGWCKERNCGYQCALEWLKQECGT